MLQKPAIRNKLRNERNVGRIEKLIVKDFIYSFKNTDF